MSELIVTTTSRDLRNSIEPNSDRTTIWRQSWQPMQGSRKVVHAAIGNGSGQRVSSNATTSKNFRSLARRRLPGPIFHYIDGAADDEVTYRRNTEAYERCDLVPNVLAGVEGIDMSTTVQKLAMPLFCSPTALQRLFHHDGERAVAKADRMRSP